MLRWLIHSEMALIRIVRIVVWSLIAMLLFATGAVLLGWWQTDRSIVIPNAPQVGGPFMLVTHKGQSVTEKDFLGKPYLVFFGFTHCPDVCPTTLSEITSRLKVLGKDADKLNVLFITADPERDTPEQLALYLQSFDSRIVGLSGTPEQISKAVRAFKIEIKKVPLASGGYTIDHTASTIMMDRNGRFVGLIDYHENDETALAKMRRLLR